jgi:dTDP-4-amino-4,6-dideoxygalactose transaminase
MTMPFDDPIYVTRPLLPNTESVAMAIDRIWASQQLTNNGSQLRELQRQLKEYLNAQHLSIFSNGTLALLLGLKALDLKGEVITTPFTFPATVQALDWNNLELVFCDIEPDTLNIDADKIESLITENTSAILAVHVFGNPCNVEKIQQIADKYKLKVIYDAAHAFGAKINGVPIQHFGDLTMFSFHATKLFHTVEGGALAFADDALQQKLELLKNFGLLNPEQIVLSGLNAKMNEIQAGIGIEVLKLVEDERRKRQEIKKAYEKNLSGIPGIRIITNLDGESSSYQYFVIEIDETRYGKSRDWLQRELEKFNIYTRKYFYPLCSEFEWHQNRKSAQPENLPVANESVKQVLSMPYYGGLPIKSVERICSILSELSSTQKATPIIQ